MSCSALKVDRISYYISLTQWSSELLYCVVTYMYICSHCYTCEVFRICRSTLANRVSYYIVFFLTSHTAYIARIEHQPVSVECDMHTNTHMNTLKCNIKYMCEELANKLPYAGRSHNKVSLSTAHPVAIRSGETSHFQYVSR